jgi:Uma2 family endonuclease
MVDGEDSMAVTLRHRRFTLDEYHRMGETGILGADDRVELIEGEIIEMAPIGSRHAATVTRIHYLFSRRLGDRAVVWVQNPLRLARHNSEPVPDVMLLVPRTDFYAGGLPEPADVRLLIEVADSSLLYDRRTKFPLYARAGVAEAWLVHLDARRLEIHRGAGDAGYRDVGVPRGDETFSADAFPDLTLTLRDLLG